MHKPIGARQGHVALNILLALFLWFAAEPAWSWNPNLAATPSVNEGDYTITWSTGPSGIYRLYQREYGTSETTLIWSGGTSIRSFHVTGQPNGRYEHWLTVRRAICPGGRKDPDNPCEWVTDVTEPVVVRVASGPPPQPGTPAQQAAHSFQVRIGDVNDDGYQDAYIRRTSGNLDNGLLAEQIIQRLSTNEFALFRANSNQLSEAKSWPLASGADVIAADLNADGYADYVVRGLPNADSQVLISSGAPYDRSGSQLGAIDDEARRFIRDTLAYLNDPTYFDDAQQPDEDGYNIRIDAVIGYCSFFYGYPLCYDYSVTLVDIDVSLDDLGLDGFLSGSTKVSPGGISLQTVGAYYSPQVHAEAEPFISEQNISDLHAYTARMNEAMQRVGPYLPPTSSDPDVLRCVYYCGTFYQYTFDGYFYMAWVDTWTPITIPGEFDHENYSVEAYEHSKQVAVFMPHFVQILTNPAAQEALKRAVITVGAAVGVVTVWEKVKKSIEDDGPDTVVDPWAKKWLEAVIGTACVDVDDPEECMIAIDKIIVEGEVPPNIAHSVDPDNFDVDYLATQFPLVAAIVSRLKDPSRVNCTYKKFSPSENQTYYGRTSGPAGDTCTNAIARRDVAHRAQGTLASFGPAIKDKGATGINGYAAIRGREQQLIDSWMVDGRTQERVANLIRGVAKYNPLACVYHLASNVAFGPLSPYTGNGSCP